MSDTTFQSKRKRKRNLFVRYSCAMVLRVGIVTFLARFAATFPRFNQILSISDFLRLDSFQRCSYFVSGDFLCFYWKWTFIKYFQTAVSAFGQTG